MILTVFIYHEANKELNRHKCPFFTFLFTSLLRNAAMNKAQVIHCYLSILNRNHSTPSIPRRWLDQEKKIHPCTAPPTFHRQVSGGRIHPFTNTHVWCWKKFPPEALCSPGCSQLWWHQGEECFVLNRQSCATRKSVRYGAAGWSSSLCVHEPSGPSSCVACRLQRWRYGSAHPVKRILKIPFSSVWVWKYFRLKRNSYINEWNQCFPQEWSSKEPRTNNLSYHILVM